MPQVNLALEKFERVNKGEATENDIQNIQVFKKLLTMLTNPPNCGIQHTVKSKDVLCVQNGESSKLKPTRNLKNNLIYDNKLQNIFDYLAAAIDYSVANNDYSVPTVDYSKDKIIDDDIKKLFKLCSIFLKIDLSKSELTLEKKNTLNIAYIGLFARIAKFPNILDISNEQNTNYQMVDLLNLTNHFLEDWAKLNTQYSIFETLKNYTESIGNLTRKAGHERQDVLPIEIQMKSLINLLTPYLNADQKKFLMFSFAHEYKSGEELSACKEVFNTTDCDPYNVTEEFLKISSASKSYDSKISLDENLDVGFRVIKKIKFDTASFKGIEVDTRKLNNFSHYFKKLIQKANDKGETLSDDFTKYLCEFLSYQFKVFKGTDTLLMSYRSSFSLFLALLKNPSAKNYTLIIRHLEQVFNPMEILLKSVLENSSNNKTLGILSTLEIFADVVHLAVNDVKTITLEEKKSINLEISKLVNLCFKIDECPTSSALDQFFNSLGSMVRNLSKKTKGDQEKRQAKTIEQTTQQLIENARNDSISLSRIRNFAYAYLYGRYDQKVDAINRDCGVLFNLEECQPAHPVNRTVENHTDFIIYKTTPAIPAVNTTLVSAINQTYTPVLIDNKTTIALPENVNHTFSNQTVDQTTPTNSSDDHISNPGLALGASAAHGVGSGMINGIIQYFATKYSRQGEQSSKAKALVIYSSLLAHAALAATFPMMLFKIQEHINQGNEDEAQQLWDVLLLNALPTFISSVVTNCSYQLVCEFIQLFSNRFHTFTQNLPLLATAYNLYSNPMETGLHLATSFATSSLTYVGLNRFFPVKNQQSWDIETDLNTKVSYNAQEKEVELLQPLHREKIVSENEVIKKTYQFICLSELEEVKKLSKDNLDQLENLIKTLEINIKTLTQQKEFANTSGILNAVSKNLKDNNHILNIMKVQFQSAEILYSALNDDIHLEACEMYTLTRKKVFVSAMEKIGNVFKLMETNFKTLQGEIKAAIGYTEASSDNFSNEVKTQLILLSQMIIFPLSKVTLYKDRYSNANAIEKTEDRCKKEANQGLFNVLIQAESAINKRTNKGTFNGNRNTFAFSSGSDGDLRTSTASSSTESEHSTISGNSAYNPIDPQQTAPLLNGRI